MRKQTKLVAVASAAALLAIGASMTSFAATGWVEEDGTWYYYDKDGNRVTDEWKKSGTNWYWLDGEEGGAMATEKLIEDGSNTYYVDGRGIMVTNTWVSVVNEDQDEDTDPAEYRYYYMQVNGKAYKNTGTGVYKKTIDGKKFAFDSEGKMLYGWVSEDGEMIYKWLEQTPSNASTSVGYKFYSTAEDGARRTKGWFKVVPNKDFDYEMSSESNDKAQWYYADGSGDVYSSSIKKIKGKYYAFDEDGAMMCGLVHMVVDEEGVITEIIAKEDDKRDQYNVTLDSDYLDKLKEQAYDTMKGSLYYFGNPDSEDSDGAMKTGNTTLNVDGSSYAFNFATAGGTGSRGAGKNGLSKKIYYKYGMKMSASSDDKYRAATIDINTDDEAIATFVSSKDMKLGVTAETATYKPGSTATTIRYYKLSDKNYKLIGTNGKLKTKANGVKDGDDWYFFSDDEGKITYYADDKNLLKADGVK